MNTRYPLTLLSKLNLQGLSKPPNGRALPYHEAQRVGCKPLLGGTVTTARALPVASTNGDGQIVIFRTKLYQGFSEMLLPLP